MNDLKNLLQKNWKTAALDYSESLVTSAKKATETSSEAFTFSNLSAVVLFCFTSRDYLNKLYILNNTFYNNSNNNWHFYRTYNTFRLLNKLPALTFLLISNCFENCFQMCWKAIFLRNTHNFSWQHRNRIASRNSWKTTAIQALLLGLK